LRARNRSCSARSYAAANPSGFEIRGATPPSSDYRSTIRRCKLSWGFVVGMLAERVGVAMEIARLRQVEDRERTRLQFLAKAGPLPAESIDDEPPLQVTAGLVVR